MKQQITTSFIFLLSIASHICQAQPGSFFVKHGNNIRAVTCGSITFSPITDMYQRATGAGSVLVKKQLDLHQPFDISFFADFNDTTAVDGAAFVLQADSNSAGGTDNSLGYSGITPSVAVTFDVIQNARDNDPSFDHIAIQSNGDINHTSSNNLAGPVSIESLYNITLPTVPGDGITKVFNHLVNVKWDPITMKLSVFADGQLLVASQKDLISQIFKGNSIVYWGFSASNTQKKQYAPGADIYMGRFIFFFGDEISPRFDTSPTLDTCYGLPVSFIDKSVYGFDSLFNGLLFSRWYWDFGDGSASAMRNPLPHTYKSAGQYEVRYVISNQLGCALDTLKRTIVLGEKPVAKFSYSSACVATPVTFTDQSSANDNLIVVWKWNFDNTHTSQTQNPVVNFTNEGTKNVVLTVGTNYGCTSDTTIAIVITGKPAADFNFTQTCDGLVNYSGVLQNTVPVQKWRWQFGDSAQSGLPSPSHLFAANGTYQTLMQVYTAEGCPSDSVIKTVVIDKLYPFAGNDTIIAAGQPLQFAASGGSSYEWAPAAGLNNPLIKDPVAVLNASQSYILTVHNSLGCTASDTINIKVFKKADLYIPNAFTPNNDGKNDVFRISAPGIESIQYFNIYNRWGTLLYRSTDINKGWNGTFNGVLQENGTYVYVIKATDYKGAVIEKRGTFVLIR